MTQGVQGIQEQISVGFLELTEDLSERLPVRNICYILINIILKIPILYRFSCHPSM